MSTNHHLTSHDLSPGAVFGQIILPRQGRYLVLLLEAIILAAVCATVCFGARGMLLQQQLRAETQVAAERSQERKLLEGKLQTSLSDHRRASQMAAWIRRNLPMQPLAIALLEAIPAGVTLTHVEAEMAEGGSPQMTLRLALRGEPEASDRAVAEIARTLFKYGLRIVDQPIPQRLSQGIEASFAVQFPPLDEWEVRL